MFLHTLIILQWGQDKETTVSTSHEASPTFEIQTFKTVKIYTMQLTIAFYFCNAVEGTLSALNQLSI